MLGRRSIELLASDGRGLKRDRGRKQPRHQGDTDRLRIPNGHGDGCSEASGSRHLHVERIAVEPNGGIDDRAANRRRIDADGGLVRPGALGLNHHQLISSDEPDLDDGERHHEKDREDERELDHRRPPLSTSITGHCRRPDR
jgi:hypothetical protein